MIATLALGAVGMLWACWAAIGPVVLWSGETITAEQVASVGAQGIEIRMSFEADAPIDARTFVAWGEVKAIQNGWGEAAEYRAVADAVRRAEQRLRRGDSLGAGAVLEPLTDGYLADVGPTSSQIASALIVTRLFAGDSEGALLAWFATLGESPRVERAWIDAESGVCPSLPPVFTPESAARFLALETNGITDATQRAMAELYRSAAVHAGGGSGETYQPEARAKADVGVRFVLDMVRAQTETDPTARRAAREALGRRARADGAPWRNAWAGLGVGVSLMGEDDARTRDAGAARLVSVLVEHRGAAPGLPELARDLLVRYFDDTGRPGHADAARSMERAALLGLSPWRDRAQDGSDDTPGFDGPGDEENP